MIAINKDSKIIPLASNGSKWALYQYKSIADEALEDGELKEGMIVGVVDEDANLSIEERVKALEERMTNNDILSDFENITLTSTATTMEYDGYLFINVTSLGSGADHEWRLTINGIPFDYWFETNGINKFRSVAEMPVAKGDEIAFTRTYGTVVQSKARFYKLRDYSER